MCGCQYESTTIGDNTVIMHRNVNRKIRIVHPFTKDIPYKYYCNSLGNSGTFIMNMIKRSFCYALLFKFCAYL